MTINICVYVHILLIIMIKVIGWEKQDNNKDLQNSYVSLVSCIVCV